MSTKGLMSFVHRNYRHSLRTLVENTEVRDNPMRSTQKQVSYSYKPCRILATNEQDIKLQKMGENKFDWNVTYRGTKLP